MRAEIPPIPPPKTKTRAVSGSPSHSQAEGQQRQSRGRVTRCVSVCGRVASVLRGRAQCGSLRRFRGKVQRNPEVGTRCQRGGRRFEPGLVLQIIINPAKYLAWRGCCVLGSPTYWFPHYFPHYSRAIRERGRTYTKEDGEP